MDRKELLKERDSITLKKKTKIHLALTYNRSLPNITKVNRKLETLHQSINNAKTFFKIN